MCRKSRAILAVVCVILCLFCLVGCNAKEPETLYKSDTVIVVKIADSMTVSEVLTGNEHNFHTVHKKRSEGLSEPYIAVDNSVVSIEVIGNGLRVHDKECNTVFTYQRKKRHSRGCDIWN